MQEQNTFLPTSENVHEWGDSVNRWRLVKEAKEWIGTPYIPGGMVKQVGCDCGTFMLGVLQACGFAKDEKAVQLQGDWFRHTSSEKYWERMMQSATLIVKAISYPTLKAEPGDLVLTKHENIPTIRFNHGGIVSKWPKVIHSVSPKVEEIDASQHWMWAYREVLVFSLFRSAQA